MRAETLRMIEGEAAARGAANAAARGKMKARIAELEDAMHDLVAVAAANMGGLAGLKQEPYPPHHVDVINRAQRLLGGRELPTP